MLTKEEFTKLLSDQGCWEREINELISCYAPQLKNCGGEVFKIDKIVTPYDLGEEIIDTLENNGFEIDLLRGYINYSDFGEYVAQESDEMQYLSSSGRIIIWKEE